MTCTGTTREGRLCKRRGPNGLCAYHDGREIPPQRARMRPLADRFWEKVEKRSPDECWSWVGFRCPKGYGRIKGPGRGGASLLAARVSFELHHGPIPSGLDVLHSCDNPPCVNPAHLHAGTESDNMREMTERGRRRGPSGDAHPLRRDREKWLPWMREHAKRTINARR